MVYHSILGVLRYFETLVTKLDIWSNLLQRFQNAGIVSLLKIPSECYLYGQYDKLDADQT